jgi:hypothetical protein
LPRGYSWLGKPRYLSAVCQNRVKFSTHHFTSMVPCLLRHKFLKRDFPGVRHIRGILFRSKLYKKRLNWHTISWHYPFKPQVEEHAYIIHIL